MTTAVWETAFWGLFGLFWAGMAGVVLMVVWRASRYFFRLEVRRMHWELRRLKIEAERAEGDWQAVVLRRVMLQDHLQDLRNEILAGSEETPLRLVGVD